jgi:hypothetical protein
VDDFRAFQVSQNTHMLLLGIPLDLGSPAFIHRKFRGLPAFEVPRNIPTTRSRFQMGYVAWVQVIFNNPQAVILASPNSAYEIDVPEPDVPTILCA